MTNQVEYTASGIISVFPFPFAIDTDTDCQVLIDGVVQSGDYSIRGQGSIDGGAVVFDNAPVAGAIITIRRQGECAVSALDASGGYLADKLVAGTGVTLATVTEVGGVQKLMITGSDISGVLLVANNLADVSNMASARANLGVYSIAEADAVATAEVSNSALLKAGNLGDLTNVPAARGNLGVYSTTETEAAITANMTSTGLLKVNNLNDMASVPAARVNLGVYSTTETNDVITAKMSSTGLLKANNLSDMASVPAARVNLGVYSTTETDDAITAKTSSIGLLKANNLADLTNVPAARTALGLDQAAYLNTAQDWTKPQRAQSVETASVGGSTVLDMGQIQNFNLTLTANVTFANPVITAAMVGQKGAIGITPAGFSIAAMGTYWKRVGTTGSPGVITGIGRIDYHIRALDRIEYAYNDVEA